MDQKNKAENDFLAANKEVAGEIVQRSEWRLRTPKRLRGWLMPLSRLSQQYFFDLWLDAS